MLSFAQKRTIVLLLSLAVGIAWLDSGASKQPVPATQTQSGQNRTDESGQGHEWEKLGHWLIHDATGFFSLWLVIVGGSQLVLFYVQLRLFRKSLAPAQHAAKAAQEAANAAAAQARVAEHIVTQLERPWIFVELSLDLYGSPDDAFEEPYALFDITNHGRGPAIIEEFHGKIASAELRPDSPLFRDEFHGIIGPGKAMEKCKIHCPSGFTYDVTVDPAHDTSFFPVPKPAQDGWEVFLRIHIRYLDITGGTHESAFCWRYDHGVCRWIKFEEEPGGKQYNYLT